MRSVGEDLPARHREPLDSCGPGAAGVGISLDGTRRISQGNARSLPTALASNRHTELMETHFRTSAGIVIPHPWTRVRTGTQHLASKQLKRIRARGAHVHEKSMSLIPVLNIRLGSGLFM